LDIAEIYLGENAAHFSLHENQDKLIVSFWNENRYPSHRLPFHHREETESKRGAEYKEKQLEYEKGSNVVLTPDFIMDDITGPKSSLWTGLS